MKVDIRTSEFWVTILAAVLQALITNGVLDKDAAVYVQSAGVYVISRIISKLAKQIPALKVVPPAAALVLVALALPARSADLSPYIRAAVGANGVWLNGPDAAFPADVEAGGTLSASLSPHISAVGGGFYGFKNKYERWDVGGRVTATDVNDPNFNIYLGIRYRGGSTAAVGPTEWAPDAGFGWKPNPVTWPNIVVGADSGYGLDSKRVQTIVALRYLFPLK